MDNYCIVFDNQTIGIEIPVSADSHTSVAAKYICNNFLQFSVLDEHGFRRLKKGVDYTEVSSAKKWGYTIIPLEIETTLK